jgi:hypothetical protein
LAVPPGNYRTCSSKLIREEFFADLDKKASGDAYEELRKFLESVPSARDPEVEKMIDSLAKQIRDEGGEWWEGYYSESFRKVFKADKEETFSVACPQIMCQLEVEG